MAFVSRAEHPRVITMALAPLPRNPRITYPKMNSIIYVCLLGSFLDDILLDRFLSCMHRFEPSFTRVEEKHKHKSTPGSSAREAWKQRQKRTTEKDKGCPNFNRCSASNPDIRHEAPVTSLPKNRSRTSRPSDLSFGPWRLLGAQNLSQLEAKTVPTAGLSG